MKKKYWVRAALLAQAPMWITACQNSAHVDTAIVELKINNMGIGSTVDELECFGWRMESEVQDQSQSAYQIVMADSEENLQKGKYIWDSGKVEDDNSTFVSYTGEKLENLQDYFWKVFVWDKDGKEVESESAFFYTGPSDEDWDKAQWITSQPLSIEVAKSQADEDSYVWKYGNGLTADYEFKSLCAARSGFVWTYGLGGEYGRHVLCRIDDIDGTPVIVIEEKDGAEVLSSETFEISSDWDNAAEHQMHIEVDDNSVQLALDENDPFSYELDHYGEICTAGLWSVRCEDYSYVDNLQILDESGSVVVSENFDTDEGSFFSPYYTYVEDGWLRVKAGYILSSGWEIPSPMLRYEFEVGKKVDSAMLYLSSLGIYEAELNGSEVSDGWFDPGCSVYNAEVYYRGFDVTSSLQEGTNALGIRLGHGRYDRMQQDWGDGLAAKGILHIVYEDGTSQDVYTDSDWSSYNNGPIRNDDMYSGEFYNASFAQADWSTPGASLEGWEAALIRQVPDECSIVSSKTEVINAIETIEPVSVTDLGNGTYVYDMGKNINGIASVKATVNAGDVITIRYAEEVNSEAMSENSRDDVIGSVWQRNLLTADNTDYYVASEDGEVTYTPSMVARGYRYVQVSGVSEAPSQVQGIFLTTDLERTGYFECSDADMNALYESVVLTQQDNYMDIPTDCPQRDERLGWAGDAQVFATTGSYNYDTYNFLKQYLSMLDRSRIGSGIYPELVPAVSPSGGANGWSDAGILLVWKLYQQYGDIRLITDNIDSMCQYMDYLYKSCEGNIRYDQGYADLWAVSGLSDDFASTAQTAYCAKVLSTMCNIAGLSEEYQKYNDEYEAIKTAFLEKYVNEDGSTTNWLQAEYVMMLAFDLCPDGGESAIGDYLDASVSYSGFHPNTGYVATPFLLPMLCEYGHADTAYKVIQQKEYPSWNYIIQNSTTLTEAWEAYMVDDSGKYVVSGSLNHVALGSVGQWYYEYVLGIKPDIEAPGYKHFYIEPYIDESLSFARGSYKSLYGTIESSWTISEDTITYEFTIPANTTATVMIEGSDMYGTEVGAGHYVVEVAK